MVDPVLHLWLKFQTLFLSATVLSFNKKSANFVSLEAAISLPKLYNCLIIHRIHHKWISGFHTGPNEVYTLPY